MSMGNDGNLYAWLYNAKGQLGLGNTIDQSTPQKVTFPLGIKPKFISLGYIHSGVIDENGDIYIWGHNRFGQIGNGNTIDQLTPIKISLPNGVKTKTLSLGGFHSMAIGEDGKLYSWGYNGYGQLGVGTVLPNYTNTATKITLQ